MVNADDFFWILLVESQFRPSFFAGPPAKSAATDMSFDDYEKKTITVGSCGGTGGSRFDDGGYSTVRKLVIAHGLCIDSIKIEYDKNGCSIWSERHGGNGGKVEEVKLDYPDEFLVSVHGCYGSITEKGAVVIRSLSFESNRKKYGPFGMEYGTSFSFPATGGKIVGFHGKCGWYLDAVGVHLQMQKISPSKAVSYAHSYVTNSAPAGGDKAGYSVFKGSVGENCDIFIAVKQKDSFNNSPLSNHKEPNSFNSVPKLVAKQTSSSSSSSDSSDDEAKNKKLTVATKPTPMPKAEGVITHGPWGGNGGTKFEDGTYTGIRQIYLSRNVGIVWMRVCYDHNGQQVWGSKHGGAGGFKTDKIIFDYPSEILTHITGTYGPLMYMGPSIIRSLTFHTNKGKHGPYGEAQGQSFTHKMDEGRIVGFHGREGLFLDAVGVHVMGGKVPAPKAPLSTAIVQSQSPIAEIDNSGWSNKLVLTKQVPSEEVSCGVVKEPLASGAGPWGGEGGRGWDDGVFTGIKQIFVTKTADAICSLQIEYDRSGQSVWSVKHGGQGGSTTHRVKFEYPHEVLNCTSGYYGGVSNDGAKVVKSLTFYSSRGKYGPFGEEVGTYFTSTTTQGKVVGFHGRSSSYLDAIGVHTQHWLGNHRNARPFYRKIFN